MSDQRERRCDGPACRLRAGDLGLGGDGARVGCLGRCDAPVACWSAARPLQLVRRGCVTAPLPSAYERSRGPWPPIVLRDVGFADQPRLEAARRRGAYRALASLPPAPPASRLVALLRLPATARLIVDAAPARPGQFAARPLCERDPHLLLEGAALAARLVGAAQACIRVRAGWPEAAQALATALAAARDDGRLAGEVTLDPVADVDAPAGATDGDGERLPAATAALLVRLVAAADDDDARARWLGRQRTALCALSGDLLRPGVYELPAAATVADAIAAAGGVVDGVRKAALGAYLADGVLARDAAQRLPEALVVFHAGRPPASVRPQVC